MAEPNKHASMGLLAQMLTAIPHTGGEDDPTFSLDDIRQDGDAVEATVYLNSGDAYNVRVEWVREKSP